MDASERDLLNPFICPSCKVVYSTSTTSERAPSTPNTVCAHTLCVACVKSIRVVNEASTGLLDKFTVKCVVCNSISQCGDEPRTSLTLMDIITEIQQKTPELYYADVPAKARSPEPEIVSLKCPNCSTMYSLNTVNAEKSAHVLMCGHTLCVECLEAKTTVPETVGPLGFDSFVECSKCSEGTLFKVFPGCATFVEDAIKWLNKKRLEQIRLQPVNVFFCSDCGDKTPYEKGFDCVTCKNYGHPKMICGFCTLNLHKHHTSGKLLPIKLCEIIESASRKTYTKVIDNVHAKEIVDMYKELFEKMKEQYLVARDTISHAKNYSDGLRIEEQIVQKAEEFATIMEKFLPKALSTKNELEELLNKLFEPLPDSPEAPKESTVHGERADGERPEKRRRLSETQETNNSSGEEKKCLIS